jgi:hypothetical protein
MIKRLLAVTNAGGCCRGQTEEIPQQLPEHTEENQSLIKISRYVSRNSNPEPLGYKELIT